MWDEKCSPIRLNYSKDSLRCQSKTVFVVKLKVVARSLSLNIAQVQGLLRV